MSIRRSLVALAAVLAAQAAVGACSVLNRFDPVRDAEPSDPGGGGSAGAAGTGGSAGSGGTAGAGGTGGTGGSGGTAGAGGTGACEPAALRCTGRLLESCNADGEWTGGVICPAHCLAALGCVACAPSTSRCTGNSVDTCDANGTWQSETTCTNQACVQGACVGECEPSTSRCTGNSVDTCDANGTWGNVVACPAETPLCELGSCGLPPSCAGGLDCGGVSCCKSIELPGGTYQMGRSTVSGASDYYSGGVSSELPEHPATVAAFSLDKYEVTVGRFRKFVEQYTGAAPAVGAGAHPLIAGTGWQSAWNGSLATSQAALKTNLACSSTYQTWTDSVSAKERHAINCVSWVEAMAFCVWDGGRLPTEAEWEYAAAGGSENRLYPWGSQAPEGTRANFSGGANTPYKDVGSTPLGDGRWGQSDLAGGMWEWAYDGYDSGWYGKSNPCNNCADTTTASNRVVRGGSWYFDATDLRAASRYYGYPTSRNFVIGFRCARTR